MNDTANGKKRPRKYRSHGFYQAKRALKAFGSRTIDKRTRTGKALAQWRTELVEDLGGVENCSVQQLTLVDLVCRQKLLLDSIDAWLLTQNVVNKRYRTLIGVCKDRQQLADSLARYLSQLGMERRRKRTSLVDMLAREPEEKEVEEPEQITEAQEIPEPVIPDPVPPPVPPVPFEEPEEEEQEPEPPPEPEMWVTQMELEVYQINSF